MSLKQISDVLLVHDDRVLLQQQLTVGVGYVKMVGTVVKTADGKTVGKVRDFEFSPDDGRIAGLFDNAVNVLRTAQQYTAFAEPDDDAGSRDDPGYVQWYLDHGKAYQQADPGRKLAAPSDIAIQSALQARQAQQPQALPPGRQPSYASQLQPQLQSQQPQLQPEPVAVEVFTVEDEGYKFKDLLHKGALLGVGACVCIVWTIYYGVLGRSPGNPPAG
ncbi:hypothetical protein WJX82_002105 [Trebouxia sp. C0006]